MAKAAKGKPEYKCMYYKGETCLRFRWNEDDQQYSEPAGTCNCSECEAFLDQKRHVLGLAKALKKAKAGAK